MLYYCFSAIISDDISCTIHTIFYHRLTKKIMINVPWIHKIIDQYHDSRITEQVSQIYGFQRRLSTLLSCHVHTRGYKWCLHVEQHSIHVCVFRLSILKLKNSIKKYLSILCPLSICGSI